MNRILLAMRRGLAQFQLVARWAFGIFVFSLPLVVSAESSLTELKSAQATFWVAKDDVRAATDSTEIGAVQLPFHWDRRFPGQAGYARFVIPFSAELPIAEAYGLYFPRIGNAYNVSVNGVMLQTEGDMGHPNGEDYAKLPRYVVIPPGYLQQNNLLEINIRVDVGRRGGLSSVILGHQYEVYPQYQKDNRFRAFGAQGVAMLSLIIGLFALALWATQVHRAPTEPGAAVSKPWYVHDPLYLTAGLAELCWAISVSDFITETPLIPWPWWGAIAVTSTTCWACCMALFCAEVAQLRTLRFYKAVQNWLGFLVLSCIGAATAAQKFGHPAALTAWYVMFALTFFGFVAWFVGKALRTRSTSHQLVALAALINIFVGLYDLYVLRFSDDYRDNTYLRYSSVLFGFTLLYIVIMRFRDVSLQARELMETLSQRITQKEKELDSTYAKLAETHRAEVQATERAKVLRDMHDGVGSHLSVAMRQLQSEAFSRSDVLHTVNDALDHLKLSVDAMHLPPGDVTSMLANLRYRLNSRLKHAGIELFWKVGRLPEIPQLDGKAMRELQFIVYAALSNVLQHAQATELTIVANHQDGRLTLSVTDNGVGFSSEATGRRGLRFMQERAQAIGATLTIESMPGSTEIEVVLLTGNTSTEV